MQGPTDKRHAGRGLEVAIVFVSSWGRRQVYAGGVWAWTPCTRVTQGPSQTLPGSHPSRAAEKCSLSAAPSPSQPALPVTLRQPAPAADVLAGH